MHGVSCQVVLMLVKAADVLPPTIIGGMMTTIALFDYAAVIASRQGGAALASAYFTTPIPVITSIKTYIPLGMPILLYKLISEDVVGMFRGPTFSNWLGIAQLACIGCIVYVVPFKLLPAEDAFKTAATLPSQPNGAALTAAEVEPFAEATFIMLIINVLLVIFPIAQVLAKQAETNKVSKKTA